MKGKVKALVKSSTHETNTSHLDTLFKQGEFLNPAQLEKRTQFETLYLEPKVRYKKIPA